MRYGRASLTDLDFPGWQGAEPAVAPGKPGAVWGFQELADKLDPAKTRRQTVRRQLKERLEAMRHKCPTGTSSSVATENGQRSTTEKRIARG